MVDFNKRYNKLKVMALVIMSMVFLSSCAPVYRFIKGKDPDHVIGTPTLSITHTNYLKDIDSNIFKVTMNQLVPGDDARLPGTSGEKETADYIGSLLEANGYDTQVNSFPVRYTMTKKVNLVDSNSNRALESVLISRTGFSPREEEFTVVDVGGGLKEDLEYMDLTDKLILVEKKFRNLDEICKDIKEMGGAGIIYYSNVETSLPRDNVSETYSFPVFSVTYDDAKMIMGRLDDKETVKFRVTKGEAEYFSKSENVLGFLDKFDPVKKTILLTANMDSTMSPGANFNASGVATLLQTAEIIGRLPLAEYNIMYAFIGASTLDNLGEKEFLKNLDKSVSDSIVLRIGLEAVGHGNTFYYQTSNKEINQAQIKLMESIVGQLGYSIEEIVDKSTINDLFEEKGINSIEFKLGPDSNAGTKLDTIDKVDLDNLKNMANIVLNIIFDFAK
ncbi:MAG: M28 family peptidase [Clostridiaceae bacterium]